MTSWSDSCIGLILSGRSQLRSVYDTFCFSYINENKFYYTSGRNRRSSVFGHADLLLDTYFLRTLEKMLIFNTNRTYTFNGVSIKSSRVSTGSIYLISLWNMFSIKVESSTTLLSTFTPKWVSSRRFHKPYTTTWRPWYRYDVAYHLFGVWSSIIRNAPLYSFHYCSGRRRCWLRKCWRRSRAPYGHAGGWTPLPSRYKVFATCSLLDKTCAWPEGMSPK